MVRCNGHSKKCKKVDLVHEFINFMCTYEAAMDNSSYISYISSNLEVMDELSSEGGIMMVSTLMFLEQDMKKMKSLSATKYLEK